jgi:hypothetical protein
MPWFQNPGGEPRDEISQIQAHATGKPCFIRRHGGWHTPGVACVVHAQLPGSVAEPGPRAHEAWLTGANEGRSRATLQNAEKELPGGVVHPVAALGTTRSCWTARHQLRQQTPRKTAACRPKVRPKLREASGWLIGVSIPGSVASPTATPCVSHPTQIPPAEMPAITPLVDVADAWLTKLCHAFGKDPTNRVAWSCLRRSP